jgi:hypothetical protein
MTVRAIAFVVVGLVAAACQSKEEGMELLCAAPDRAGIADVLPEEQGRVLARWIESNVSNADARRLFEQVIYAPLPDAARLAREASEGVGLNECAWADYYDRLVKEVRGLDGSN